MPSELHVDPHEWGPVVADVDGPQLVVGGPGSGKTEFLVRRARHLVDECDVRPEELVVLSFSRRSAAALRDRISASLDRSLSELPVSTFHSLAMRIVEAHGAVGDWDRVPALLTGPEQVSLVAELLATEDPSAWPQPFRGLLTDEAFADEVADFLLRAAERLADGDAIAALGRADWRALPAFLERYRNTLVERGRIDYGTLQAEAVRLLADPGVRSQTAERVRYVLVDEYQDTTVAQAAIVEGVAVAGNVTVAGDPYQSIYSFRGAELSNVAEFPERFRRPGGGPARRIVLTTSFRVPEAILDAAVRVTSGAGLPGAAGPMEPAGPGGSVETHAFDQRIHLRDRIPYDRIAVFVRSKRRFLPELSRALERRRIPHERPDNRLVDHPAVRPVLDLVRAASEPGPAGEAALRRILLGPLCRLTLSTARELERRTHSDGSAAALDDPLVPDGVADLLRTDDWATSMAAAEGFWRVWTTVEAYRDVVTDEARGADRRALAAFGQALDRLLERAPQTTLAEYARMSEAEDFEATPLLEYRGGEDHVTLTTLHQSKGMTFDVVFVADAREGVLPDLRTRDSLLGARHLSPDLRGDDTAYARFRLQEEMRLAYSAMCRAARRVVWTCTATGFEAGEGVPSRFLPMVAGTSMEEATRPPQPWSRPTTPLEAEAWLRRRIADPGLPMVDRLAAVGMLADDAPWRPRDPVEFAGILERGPDRGLVGEHAVLSASQADSYTRCPRRYAFERRLRIDSGGSSYQELGSVVHRTLERVERAAAERGDERASTEEALSALDDEFDPEAFGGGPWGEAWHARARTIVERLYELWPGDGPGVAFEQEIDLELGGTRWVGRIDRVERRGDSLHVVDYKTGTGKPTVGEAAVSLQLGLYLLGLRDRRDEPVAGAEYWYPAADMRRAKSVVVRRLDPDRLDEVRDALDASAAGITAEDWRTIPGTHCERCPVKLVCPEWPEGQEAFRP